MANKNYKSLLESLNNRLNPDRLLLEKSFTDELRQVPYNESLLYIKRAMRGVEPEYTSNTILAGNKSLSIYIYGPKKNNL